MARYRSAEEDATAHLRLSDLLRAIKISNWRKELQPHNLIERRCFLGWTEEAHVMIGSELYSSTKIRASGTQATPRTQSTKSHSITVGTSGMGFATGTGTRTWMPTSIPSRITLYPDKDIYDILADGRDDHVFIYDHDAKTGWCVPIASVALYVIHLVILRRKYKIYDGDILKGLNFAAASFDLNTEASKVLEDCLHLKVRKLESKGRLVEKPFSETVRQVLHALITIGTQLDSVEEELREAGLCAPRYICGVEFKDVIEMRKDSLRIKQAEVNQPWAYLTRYQPKVLFCKGLGQPIIPYRPEKLFQPWMNVPRDENYLVAIGLAFRHFLEDEDDGNGGSRLAHEVDWILDKPLLQSHRRGCKDPLLHVQRLRSVKSSQVVEKILRTVENCLRGGFIFANDANNPNGLCSALLQDAPPKPNHYHSDPPEVPESASDTSENTSESFDTELQKQNSSPSNEPQDAISMEVDDQLLKTTQMLQLPLQFDRTTNHQQKQLEESTRPRALICPKPLSARESSFISPDAKSLKKKQKSRALRVANMDR